MDTALNLTQSAWTRQRGDMTAYGAWFGDQLRPCIALVPTYRKQYKPAVVLIDDAWQWEPRTGVALYVQREAPNMARAMGFDDDSKRCAKIANFINDCLGDLLSQPPKPVERVAMADAVVTDESGNAKEFVITEAH